ncbi:UbiA family prenyltransferase [Streptomyces sp. NRRL S-1868]|uniref:UbiA family prenyltransferase n=1 Tax=Streptomyces sp. NRRL S-1868 TaxID=1463892 RepID=UPI00056D3427|nr:UbiA family prenyltransferase [Streptomyces sp. NRRL S-1868]
MTGRAAAWAQLLRVSAVSTVPGDAFAGAAAVGGRPNRGTALAAVSSLFLYEAGMALNDWADRDEDAVERPDRPLPSGRIAPSAALAAAGALTVAGLATAARAGRPALATASALAATVWAYDLHLKHTPAGPATMATARSLNVLLGTVATAGRDRTGNAAGTGRPGGTTRPGTPTGRSTGGSSATPARQGHGRTRGPGHDHAYGHGHGHAYGHGYVHGGVHGDAYGRAADSGGTGRGSRAGGAAALMGLHTLAVTTVSRREAQGGAPAVPLGALAVVGAITTALARGRTPHGGRPHGGTPHGSTPRGSAHARGGAAAPVLASAAAYAATAARPLAHAALNPSPPLLQGAVGAGIRAMIPLQAALAARSAPGRGRLGGAWRAAPLLALLPVARRLSRKVSPT